MVAGGHCTFNPEPLADFVDVFVIGDGEEVVGEITDAVRDWKSGADGRVAAAVLRDLARVPGRVRARPATTWSTTGPTWWR